MFLKGVQGDKDNKIHKEWQFLTKETNFEVSWKLYRNNQTIDSFVELLMDINRTCEKATMSDDLQSAILVILEQELNNYPKGDQVNYYYIASSYLERIKLHFQLNSALKQQRELSSQITTNLSRSLGWSNWIPEWCNYPKASVWQFFSNQQTIVRGCLAGFLIMNFHVLSRQFVYAESGLGAALYVGFHLASLFGVYSFDKAISSTIISNYVQNQELLTWNDKIDHLSRKLIANNDSILSSLKLITNRAGSP